MLTRIPGVLVSLMSFESRVFKTARVASGKKTGRGIFLPVKVLKWVGLVMWQSIADDKIGKIEMKWR